MKQMQCPGLLFSVNDPWGPNLGPAYEGARVNLKWKQNANQLLYDCIWFCFVVLFVLWTGWEKAVGELGLGYFLGGFRPVLHADRWREHSVQQAGQPGGGHPSPVQQQRWHPVAPAGRDVLLRLQQTQVPTHQDARQKLSAVLKIVVEVLQMG